ncbi:MAG: hypothetical protein ACK5HY_06840 [Parahaliea sp.]
MSKVRIPSGLGSGTTRAVTLALLLASLTTAAAIPPPRDAAPWVGTTLEGSACDGGPQLHGPFDYLQRAEFARDLRLTEDYHFNSKKQDLFFTLRVWPNHHQALYQVVRLRIASWGDRKNKPQVPAECFLQRAVNFSPKDATAHMLYGLLLHRLHKNPPALEHYRKAVELNPTDLQTKYNLALLLVDMEEYAEAQQLAREVYAGNFPLQGLKSKLARLGYWQGEQEQD